MRLLRCWGCWTLNCGKLSAGAVIAAHMMSFCIQVDVNDDGFDALRLESSCTWHVCLKERVGAALYTLGDETTSPHRPRNRVPQSSVGVRHDDMAQVRGLLWYVAVI